MAEPINGPLFKAYSSSEVKGKWKSSSAQDAEPSGSISRKRFDGFLVEMNVTGRGCIESCHTKKIKDSLNAIPQTGANYK